MNYATVLIIMLVTAAMSGEALGAHQGHYVHVTTRLPDVTTKLPGITACNGIVIRLYLTNEVGVNCFRQVVVPGALPIGLTARERRLVMHHIL